MEDPETQTNLPRNSARVINILSCNIAGRPPQRERTAVLRRKMAVRALRISGAKAECSTGTFTSCRS